MQKAGCVGATALNELLNDVKANYGMLLFISTTYLVELQPLSLGFRHW